MLSTSPFSWDKHPLENGSQDLNKTCENTTNGTCSPSRRSKWLWVSGLDIVFSIQSWGVVGSVHPVDGSVDNPDSIKVGDEMQPGSDFLIGLEKDILPFNLT
jgi:hypothetical protein